MKIIAVCAAVVLASTPVLASYTPPDNGGPDGPPHGTGTRVEVSQPPHRGESRDKR